MSNISNEGKLGFLLGWLVGRRRRRPGVSILFLLIGLLGLLSSCAMLAFGIPSAFLRSKEVKALPRPDPSELRSLASGTSALVVARLDPEGPTDRHGLALFYVESRRTSGSSDGEEEDAEKSSSTLWQKAVPAPQKIEMFLEDETSLMVQFSATATFLNAERFEDQDLGSQGEERRTVGYLPGQTLTIEGTWEGDGLFTSRAVYAGGLDEYARYRASQPGTSLLQGLICGGIGVLLLGIAAILRIAGR